LAGSVLLKMQIDSALIETNGGGICPELAAAGDLDPGAAVDHLDGLTV
jgi:hypothetical protein